MSEGTLCDLIDPVVLVVFAHYCREDCDEIHGCEGYDFDRSGTLDLIDLAGLALIWMRCLLP